MNRLFVLLILLALVVSVFAAAPFVGMHDISVNTIWDDSDSSASKILWELRVPRVVMAMLAGTALALSGMVFQAMFRNPLATPFTLGVASGASLGASVCIHLGLSFSIALDFGLFSFLQRHFPSLSHLPSRLEIPAATLFAFGGALCTILLVYGLTRLKRGFSTTTMLLAGVAISFFCSSLILFLQYLSDFTRTYRMLRWVMGGLDNVVGFGDVCSVFLFVVVGTVVVLTMRQELNLINTGEELATARGVAVARTKIVLFFTASFMVGAVVAVCGPIGFVGLMAPHICRLLIGPDHRYLAPATLLFGGAFLAVCDTVARTVMAPTELPVGILTALLGGPFFLCLLLWTAQK
jgi:iron complex transport system permease protein